jgi:hypothetical protein
VLIASDDDGAASDALQKFRDASGSTYAESTLDGVTVWAPASTDEPAMAIVDGTVVLGERSGRDGGGDPDGSRCLLRPGRPDLSGRDGPAARRQPRVRLRERPRAHLAGEPRTGRDGCLDTQLAAYQGAGTRSPLDPTASRSTGQSPPIRASSRTRSGRRSARVRTRCWPSHLRTRTPCSRRRESARRSRRA